ncbi:spermidine synthase [Nocardioides sp. Bht2]|uniref:spermidine synthase n=1 Tax=Nocardioides sp. Bht2 TaxID=3392297 RepID=UPI0039B539D4
MSRDLYVLDLDGMQQSAVDVADPTYLAFDYMRRIGTLIDAMPAGRLRILHVGGAAMSLPRYVAARRPGSAQIVLEPAVEVIEQVRRELPLPPRSGIKVRPVDGLQGIAVVRDDSQDLVILDAFADAEVPPELLSAEFIAEVGRVLAEGGVFAANLVDRPPFENTRRFVAAVRGIGEVSLGLEPATLKGKRAGNVVVVAGSLPTDPWAAPSPMEYRVYRGAAVQDSFGGGR